MKYSQAVAIRSLQERAERGEITQESAERLAAIIANPPRSELTGEQLGAVILAFALTFLLMVGSFALWGIRAFFG